MKKNIPVLPGVAALLLAACGGGGNSAPPPPPPPPPPPASYTVAGTVTGSSGSLVLQLNGANNLTVNAPGGFTFASPLVNASTYTVTVLTAPDRQGCTVGNGSGTISGANITNIAITCANLPVLSGVAAVGTPLAGTVTVKDALGASRTADIGTNGSYSINVEGMTAPFVLRAEGTANGQKYIVHSAAVAADLGGNINVTQLTDLAIANIAHQIAAAYFDAGDFNTLTPAALDAEVTLLRTRLQPVLQALGVDAAIDLLRARFTPTESALDSALDLLRVNFNTSTNIATITNVVTQQQIQDDLAIPAATESDPAVMTDITHVADASNDRDAIVAAVAAVGGVFANGLPSPAALSATISPTFLNDDEDRADVVAELVSDPTLVKSTWTDVDIRMINYADPAGPTAVVDFSIKDQGGREFDRVMLIGVRKDSDGTWRISGNQRVMRTEANVLSYKSLSRNCISTGIEFQIEDYDPLNNGGAINHIQVFGPGLPMAGLRFVPSNGEGWVINGTQGSRYEFANNCGYVGVPDPVIASIPDNAFYLFLPYSSADQSVRVSFPSGAIARPGTPVDGAYLDLVAKRAPTLAEAVASTSFPAIDSPASAAALAGYTGGPRQIVASHLNVGFAAGVILEYRTQLGNDAFTDADYAPAADGTLSASMTLPALPMGDAITFRSLRVSTHDDLRREWMTGYEDIY